MEEKITKEKLKDLAGKLMFDMEAQEYATLESEFAIILKQMSLIDNIKDIDKTEPMHFPFCTYENQLREDVVGKELTVDEVLSNSKHVKDDRIKVAKVVK